MNIIAQRARCGRATAYLFHVFLAIALLLGARAQARIFVISDTTDTTGITSLRGAIIAANASGGHNTIILRPGVYQLSIPGPGENGALTGDLDVASGMLEIIGDGSDVTITAVGLGDRVFHVWPEARLDLLNLIINGGQRHVYEAGIGGGGGILNDGALTLNHCVISENSLLVNGDGGGICNNGSLNLTNCDVSGNLTTVGVGGGICNNGDLIMDRCAIVGNSGGTSGGTPGGGIFNRGRLNMSRCVISGNSAADAGPGLVFPPTSPGGNGGNGGGLFNDQSGVVVLEGCTISSNVTGSGEAGQLGAGGAGGCGGGVYNVGSLRLNDSTIRDNCCRGGAVGSPAGPGGCGGGLYNVGSLTIARSSIFGNCGGLGGGQGGSGGGVYNSGVLLLDNSTISGNTAGAGGGTASAGGDGGAIYNVGSFLLTSCTICRNSGGSGGAGAGPSGGFFGGGGMGGQGGPGGNGGGIYCATNSVLAKLRNTLIASNLVGEGGPGGSCIHFAGGPCLLGTSNGPPGLSGISPDICGSLESQGFNLVGNTEGSSGFASGVNGDLVGASTAPIDPLIGPLQLNGGPTPTHALLPGSPAIDSGRSFGLATDQRGRHRPHDYPFIPNAPGSDGSDIGAFESYGEPPRSQIGP